MLIDWFTVIAQVVNFLVLVWLLKRFLYGPVLSIIDAREKGIAARFMEAEAKKVAAQTECEDFQRKSETLELQRGAILRKAADDANAERERGLAEARKDAAAARSAWQAALRSEQRDLGKEIVQRTQQGVFDIARKTLADLATTDLEVSMSNAFIARLRGLNGAERSQFTASLKASAQPVLVRSVFDLPPAQREAIKTALGEAFAVQPQIRFEAAPDLVCGIEIAMNGQKVAWSISDFLISLQKDVGDLVEEKTKLDVQPAIEDKSALAPEIRLGAEAKTKAALGAASR